MTLPVSKVCLFVPKLEANIVKWTISATSTINKVPYQEFYAFLTSQKTLPRCPQVHETLNILKMSSFLILKLVFLSVYSIFPLIATPSSLSSKLSHGFIFHIHPHKQFVTKGCKFYLIYIFCMEPYNSLLQEILSLFFTHTTTSSNC